MKKIIFLLMFSILTISSAFAQFVEIGDSGSTNVTNFAPLNSLKVAYAQDYSAVSNSVIATIENALDEMEAPINLTATVSASNVTLDWLAPGTILPDLITEGFEVFPPADWSIDSTNTVETWKRYARVLLVNGYATPTEGIYQAGLMWDIGHQDEWLITPQISNPLNITFDYFGDRKSVV